MYALRYYKYKTSTSKLSKRMFVLIAALPYFEVTSLFHSNISMALKKPQAVKPDIVFCQVCIIAKSSKVIYSHKIQELSHPLQPHPLSSVTEEFGFCRENLFVHGTTVFFFLILFFRCYISPHFPSFSLPFFSDSIPLLQSVPGEEIQSIFGR